MKDSTLPKMFLIAGLSLLLGISILSLGGCLAAEDLPFSWPVAYTIEYTQTKPGDPARYIYMVSGNKVRNELVSLNGKPASNVIIFDLDKQTMISILPNIQVSHESSLANKGVKLQHMFDASGTWKKMVTEEVNGMKAEKYKITYDKPEDFIFVWLSQGIRSPLQMTNRDGTLFREVHRYVAGAVGENNFTVPSGYHKDNPAPERPL